MGQVYFVLVLHSHQPVGNFDGVIERACLRAYEPLVAVLEKHPQIPVVMHYSGGLLEWIESHRLGLFEKIKLLVRRGQVELLGGGFYEPILGMIPEGDRLGQICEYRDWLRERLGTEVRGIWLAERLWEQSLVKSLVEAGVEYTVVDDTHFRYAGLRESEVCGYFLTDGSKGVLKVFPGSEYLRYAIPFKRPGEAIKYLRRIAERCEDAVVVYADDGEKFGLWPNTFRHVYERGWLEDFFGVLNENRDWIRLTTLRGVVDAVAPRGEVFLPNVSYREMMEWAQPAKVISRHTSYLKPIERLPQGDSARRFVRGGSWRNFLVKYPEASQMYARMLEVSRAVASINPRSRKAASARRELYKAQCNDAYWHGIFGGLYLPHLRTAVFKHLLAAEAMTDSHRGVHVEKKDYDLDAEDEFRLSSPVMNAYFKPSRGGHLYELDYRPGGINLINTLTRREEAYHRRLLHGKRLRQEKGVKSIHERMPEVDASLRRQLLYDSYQKESLVEHFFPLDTDLSGFVRGVAVEMGDFVTSPYTPRVRRRQGRVTLQMERQGFLSHGRSRLPLKVRKEVAVGPARPVLLIVYRLENLSRRKIECSFGVEFNISMSAGRAPGRYYALEDKRPSGNLAAECCFPSQGRVSLVDEAIGVMVTLEASSAADVWVCPVETISQSESGFDKVYQCSTVLLKWALTLRPGTKWEVCVRKGVSEV